MAFMKHIRFDWNGKIFQFLAFPFGLPIDPLVFQKVVARLHTLSVQTRNNHLSKAVNPESLLTTLAFSSSLYWK